MEYGYKYAYGSQLKAEEQIFWNIGKNILLSGGITYEKFTAIPKTCDMPEPIDLSKNLSSVYIGTNIPMNFFVLNYQNAGAFLQTRISLKEKLFITLGTRWDKNSRFEATFNPRLGLVFAPTQKLIFKLLYGKAFMAPSPLSTYENYGSFYSEDGGQTYKSYYFHLPNPNLKPIYMENFELSAQYSPVENFNIQLNSYLIFLNNLHTFASDKETLNLYDGKFMGAEVDYISIKINSGSQKSYGGTLQMNYFREFGGGKLQAYLAATYTDGRTSNDTPISFTSPFVFRAGFDLQYKKISFSPRLVAIGEQITDNKKVDSNEHLRMKGYQLLNFTFRWNFYKKSYLTLNVQNALNQRYSQVGWFNPEDQGGESAYKILNGIREPLRFQLGVQLNVF
jgi:iron complex outermembrane receptor protein